MPAPVRAFVSVSLRAATGGAVAVYIAMQRVAGWGKKKKTKRGGLTAFFAPSLTTTHTCSSMKIYAYLHVARTKSVGSTT